MTAVVVLDANVLHSNLLRGLFLWLAKLNLCQPIWSVEIWDEVFRNRPGDEEDRRKFKNAIEGELLPQFSDSMRPLVAGYQILDLPDRDDEHVVALARQEKVPIVVTFNLKDFPARLLGPVGITCLHPDDFLCGLYETRAEIMNSALHTHLLNLTRTKPTRSFFIECFRKADTPRFAACLMKASASGNLFPEVWT